MNPSASSIKPRAHGPSWQARPEIHRTPFPVSWTIRITRGRHPSAAGMCLRFFSAEITRKFGSGAIKGHLRKRSATGPIYWKASPQPPRKLPSALPYHFVIPNPRGLCGVRDLLFEPLELRSQQNQIGSLSARETSRAFPLRPPPDPDTFWRRRRPLPESPPGLYSYKFPFAVWKPPCRPEVQAPEQPAAAGVYRDWPPRNWRGQKAGRSRGPAPATAQDREQEAAHRRLDSIAPTSLASTNQAPSACAVGPKVVRTPSKQAELLPESVALQPPRDSRQLDCHSRSRYWR